MMNAPAERSQKKGAGCCIAVLVIAAIFLLIGGLLAVTVGSKVLQWGKEFIAEQQERAQWSRNWQPPAQSLDYEALFPQQIGEFQRNSHEVYWDLVDTSGLHALYTNGSSRRYISVYLMSEQEKARLFGQLEEILEGFEESFTQEYDGGSSTSRLQLGNRYSYSIRVGEESRRFVFWWIKGFLFQFYGEDAHDLYPFIEKYLAATTGQAT